MTSIGSALLSPGLCARHPHRQARLLIRGIAIKPLSPKPEILNPKTLKPQTLNPKIRNPHSARVLVESSCLRPYEPDGLRPLKGTSPHAQSTKRESAEFRQRLGGIVVRVSGLG